MPKLKSIFYIVLYIAAGAGVLWLIMTNLEAYSNYGNALLLATTATGLLYAIDTWVLHGWDTIEEIKKGNVAAGLAILAYAVVIGSCILAAFIVWK